MSKKPEIFNVKTREELLQRIKDGDDFKGVDDLKRTVLGNCVAYGFDDIIKELIKRKVNLEERSGKKQLTPLEISITTIDNEHITKQLLRAGAKVENVSKDVWTWANKKTLKMIKDHTKREKMGVFADLMD